MLITRAAIADGGGDAGMLRVRRPLVVVVVVVLPPREVLGPGTGIGTAMLPAGRLAMTVEMIVPGVTPTVAGAQPATREENRTAVAPTRGSLRGYMPEAKAALEPERQSLLTRSLATAW